jgi:hypothetical protein
MTYLRVVHDFVPPDQLAGMHGAILAQQHRFKPVGTKAGMNLPYKVLNGYDLREHLPALAAFAAGPMLTVAQELAGEPLQLMADTKRDMRLQWYHGKHEGFRWHLDGGLYGALFTVTNDNEGATEMLTPRKSRWLWPVPYVLYPFPRILELAGPEPIAAGAGDLVVIRGGEIIHRGVIRRDRGDRILLAASFDPVGRARPRVWDALARWLNY